MLSVEKIKRINELAKKSKETGLTAEEKEEQSVLRNEYIQSVRSSLQHNLDSITVVNVDEEGNEVKRTALKNKFNKPH